MEGQCTPFCLFQRYNIFVFMARIFKNIISLFLWLEIFKSIFRSIISLFLWLVYSKVCLFQAVGGQATDHVF